MYECTLQEFKGVGLGYERQLYFQCLLKYMVICAFENPSSIPSFLATQIVYIGYGQFKKKYSVSFYLSIAVLLVFLYLITDNNSVLLLHALCPQNIIEISLSRKKLSSKYVVKNARSVTHFVWQIFSIEFQGIVR